MNKYFGTDGFRGEAGVGLTADQAFCIGRFFGAAAAREAEEGERGAILIGKDTRRSGDMLEHALAAGIAASGADAYLTGVITTPGVAHVTRMGGFSFGIMVSASHNPYQDNGIKVLNANGEKLEASVICDVEAFLDGETSAAPYALRGEIGRIHDYPKARDVYAEHLALLAKSSFDGFRVALDCANGSAYELAERVFRDLGADVVSVSITPDGENINVGCGSTHIETLSALVRSGSYDLGFAYDGDADRCIAVDGSGSVVDGDQIMYLCAMHMRDEGRLANGTVVTTVMSNYGLYKAFDEAGITYEKTRVGDKYVYENMKANGHMLGGEQSGHIIFREYATTGDGILTSLMVMEAVIASGKTLTELVEPLVIYPQMLKNVRVRDKVAALGDAAVQKAIADASAALEGTGRVLVRESGTEPLIRVMAEAPTHDECEKHVDSIVGVLCTQGHAVA